MIRLLLGGTVGLVCAMLAAPVGAQHHGGSGTVIVACESIDFRDNYCTVETRGGVRLVRQLGKSACYEGETWGYDRRGIWVSQGCRGEFELGVVGSGAHQRGDHAGGYDRGGYDRGRAQHDGHAGRGAAQTIVCESRDYHYNYCPARIRRDVDLVSQFSKTECRHGRSWGWDRGGVWVDRGCAGEFAIY